MRCRLAQGVSACAVDDRLVFLSLRQDRYFMLPGDLEVHAARVLCGRPFGDGDVPARLFRTGLFECAGQEGASSPLFRSLPAPRTSLLDESRAGSGPLPVLSAAIDYLRARHRLARRGLEGALASLHDDASTSPVEGGGRAYELAAAFAALGLLVSPLDRCLPLSLAMADRARRSGVQAKLVLGVRLGPFAAHAWVQQRERVLNDTLDHVRTFTPILVL